MLEFLVELVAQHYDVQAVSFHRFHSDSGKHIYRVELANQGYRILRLVEGEERASLIDLARLLLFFEGMNYPAERVISTKQHMTVGSTGAWHFVMTTFLVGSPLQCSPLTFSLLGATLGQLHALTPLLTYTLPPASMLIAGERAYAEQQLGFIASLVPKRYIAQYKFLQTALSSLDPIADVPATLIHNDCHPGNALLTASKQVTLFDWEGSGMGSAILDVGFLLSNCDGKAPWEPLVSSSFPLNEANVRAVVEGYSQHHLLTAKELDHLADAIRFRSLIFGACSFAASIAQYEDAEFSQWWWRRYGMAEEIADKAALYFERGK